MVNDYSTTTNIYIYIIPYIEYYRITSSDFGNFLIMMTMITMTMIMMMTMMMMMAMTMTTTTMTTTVVRILVR